MKLLPIQLPPVMDRLPLALPFSPDLLWRYPLGFPQQPPVSPFLDFKTHLPTSLASDPRVWSREDVSTFLRWCEREFDLPQFDMEMFQMNGKAVCLLTKSDLAERAPGAGDVVHNVLQLLVRDAQSRMPSSPVTPTTRSIINATSLPSNPQNWTLLPGDFHNLGHFMNQTNSVTLSPAPSVDSQSGSPQHHDSVYLNMFSSGNSGRSGSQSDSEDSFQDTRSPQRSPAPPTTPALPPPIPPQAPPPLSPSMKDNGRITSREFFPSESPEPNTNGRLLWDFLQQLLNDPSQRYTNYIAWKNRETGVFKIVDPAGLAKLWGIQKNHLSMNYDKMSRALRYYYRVNILRKVQGERHCYQFLRNPSELKNIKNISLLRQQVSNCSRPTIKLETPESLSPDGNEIPADLSMMAAENDNMPTDLSMVSSDGGNVPTDLSGVCQNGGNLNVISSDAGKFPTDLSRMCSEGGNKPADLSRDNYDRHINQNHVMLGKIKNSEHENKQQLNNSETKCFV